MNIKISGILLLASVFISACGGSDGGSDTTDPENDESSEGLWLGTASNGRDIYGIVLDDGTYYVLYTDTSLSYIAGIVQGTSSTAGSTFNSTNARDFNLEGEGILTATVTGAVTTKESFNGSIEYGDGTVTFSSTYSADYDIEPSLSTLAGDYFGEVVFSLGYELADITIAQDGTIVGVGESGCAFTGLAYPRTSGNVFNVSITFGGDPCFFANETLNGIIYYNETENYIYAAAPNANRTDGVLFEGFKL